MSAAEFKGETGLARLSNALGYSRDGIAAAWKNEAAFREEILLAAVTIPLALYLGRNGVDAGFEEFQLALGDHERDHDLRNRRRSLLGNVERRFEHGARLHLVDLGINDRQPAAAEAEHRIALGQLLHARGEPIGRHAKRRRNFANALLVMRQEFVQRRIEETDGHRPAGHRFEDADKIRALMREEFAKRLGARGFGLGDDHLAHRYDARWIEEHVFGPAKADAFGAKLHRDIRILGTIGVRAHLQTSRAIGPFHDGGEIAGEFGLDHLRFAEQHFAG